MSVQPQHEIGENKSKGGAIGEITRSKKATFLKAFASCGQIEKSARIARISRESHYCWLKQKSYAAQFAIAKERAVEWLEDQAFRRATRAKAPSDLLLIFLLKGALPRKYRDNYNVQLSNPDGSALLDGLRITYITVNANQPLVPQPVVVEGERVDDSTLLGHHKSPNVAVPAITYGPNPNE